MSAILVIAALLTLGIGIVHSWLGERRIVMPILAGAEAIPTLRHPMARRVVRFAWHLTTLAWIGFAAILLGLAFPAIPADRLALTVIAAAMLISGLVTLTTSRGKHIAWPFFLAVWRT